MTPARCRLQHLECRIGFKVLESDAKGPTRIEVWPMDDRTTWKRVAPDCFELEVDGPEGGHHRAVSEF